MMGRLIAITVSLTALNVGVAQAQYFPYGGYGQGMGGYGAFGSGVGGMGMGGYGGMGGGYGYGFNQNAYGPYMNQGPYAPNPYNRANQPLSPYLNLLRGSNPAANYFYGVRPGTQPSMMGSGGFANVAMGGMKMPFFPQQYEPDPLADVDSPGRILPPAGHPVVFNNTLGYFPNPYQMGRSGMRPGMMGMGQSQSKPATKK